jgi:hypothetical protein
MIDMFKGIEPILQEAADSITERLKGNLLSDDTYATGDTERSIKATVRGKEIRITFNKSLSAIDTGNAPNSHSPMWQKIVRWMQAKGIRPRLKGRFVAGTTANYKRSAFAISKAIYRQGTIKRFAYQGTRIFERSWSSGYKGALTKRVKQQMDKNLKEAVNVIFSANGFTK